jgi:hypothetical protein
MTTAVRHVCNTAAGGRPRSRLWADAARVAKRFEPAIAEAYLAVVAKIRARFEVEEQMTDLLRTKNIPNVVLPYDEFLARTLADVSRTSGAASAKTLSDALGVDVTFNGSDPNVVLYARDRSSLLVAAINDDVRTAIRTTMALGAEQGITNDQLARAIREIVGVAPNYAEAPSRLVQEILDGDAAAATSRRLSGVDKARIRSAIKNGTATPAFAEEMRAKYSASLRNLRGKTIARTESLAASHEGQRINWRQAMKAGQLPTDARRVWIVTPDDRLSEEHALIPSMNPNGRGLDEAFATPEGAFMQPPTRPNCRCGVGLIFPGRRGVL